MASEHRLFKWYRFAKKPFIVKIRGNALSVLTILSAFNGSKELTIILSPKRSILTHSLYVNPHDGITGFLSPIHWRYLILWINHLSAGYCKRQNLGVCFIYLIWKKNHLWHVFISKLSELRGKWLGRISKGSVTLMASENVH